MKSYSLNLFEKKWEQWLNKRIPAASRFELNRQNIFIFPSKFGLQFLALSIIIMLLGFNYQNNLVLLLSYFIWSLFLVSLPSCYLNFACLTLSQGKIEPTYAGHSARLVVNIQDRQLSKHQGNLHLSLQKSKDVYVVNINNSSGPCKLEIPCPTRGVYPLPKITVKSYYPFGLFCCWTHLSFTGELIVFPTPSVCEIPKLDSASESEQQNTLSEKEGIEEFQTLKPYQLGDTLNHIAWKQVAKNKQLVSKHFSQTTPSQVLLKLNPHSNKSTEEQLSNLCYLAHYFNETGIRFGLALNQTSIRPDKGVRHLQNCLIAMAKYPGS